MNPATLASGFHGLVALLLVSLVMVPDTALAQTQLPGIVVTTPSPVARSRPAQAAPAAADTAPDASPAGTIVDESFAPLTVVTDTQIDATPGSNLADSLQYRPGLTASNFAAGASRPIIRGLDNNRVRVQENGVGSHDVSALSEDHAVPIDPFSVDQIEVVRGPATLRYGSQAIGGVVNATNNRIPEFVPRGGFSASVTGGMGSVDRSADGAFKVTAGSGNWVLHADGFKRDADDYGTPRGRERNSFVNSDGYSLGGSFVGPNGYVGVAYVRFNSLYGIPGGEALEELTRIDMHQDKVMSKGEWRVRDYGIEAIRFWFGGTNYAHNELALETGTPEIGSRFTNKENEGRIEIQHMPVMTPFGELRGAVGTQLRQRDLAAQSFEGDSLLDPNRTRSIAGFWFEELQMTKRLRLQGAARIEETNVVGTGLDFSDPLLPTIAADRTFHPLSVSAGLLYQLPLDVVARLTAQYVQRAPDSAELFSKGAHEATGTFEIGNPDLRTEAAQTYELGFKKSLGRFRFDTSLYYTKFDGFIFKQRTGATCDATAASCAPGPGGEFDQVLFQQRDATFYGLELGGQYDVAKVWRGLWGVDAQYDFVRASFEDAAGGNVPRIPPHRLGGGIYYRDTNWFARVGMLHAFDQNRIGENETPTKGYTLLNADLAYTLKFDKTANIVPEMIIGLKGENLLNDDVRNAVSFKKDEVLEPGRTVRLYGTIKLN